MHFIYLAMKGDEYLYVGITNNVNQRMSGHTSDKKWFGEHDRILYAEMPTKTEADMYETYLINKHHPQFNSAKLSDAKMEIVHFDENKILWKRWERSNLRDVEKKLKSSTQEPDIEKKKKIIDREIEYIEKVIKPSHDLLLSKIEGNYLNLSNVYYDRRRCLCLDFNVELFSEVEINQIHGVKILSSSSYGSERTILCLTDNIEHRDDPSSLENNRCLTRLYELIDFESRQLDRMAGVNANMIRIRLINELFESAINKMKSVSLKSLFGTYQSELTFLELQRLCSIDISGQYYLDLDFKDSHRRVFFDSELYNRKYDDYYDDAIQCIKTGYHQDPFLKEWVLNNFWFEQKGDQNPMEFSTPVDKYYFDYVTAKLAVTRVSEYPDVILKQNSINDLKYEGLFSDLEVVSVAEWLEY